MTNRAVTQTHARLRPANAPAVQTQRTTATIDIHLHGNCTNRSLGSSFQRGFVTFTINAQAAAAAISSAHQARRISLLSFPSLRHCRRIAVASANVSTTVSTPISEATRLKWLRSGSLIAVNRKL